MHNMPTMTKEQLNQLEHMEKSFLRLPHEEASYRMFQEIAALSVAVCELQNKVTDIEAAFEETMSQSQYDFLDGRLVTLEIERVVDRDGPPRPYPETIS